MLYYSQYHNLLLIDRDGQLQQKIVLDSPSFGRRMVCRLVGALVAALFAGNGSDRAKHFANAANRRHHRHCDRSHTHHHDLQRYINFCIFVIDKLLLINLVCYCITASGFIHHHLSFFLFLTQTATRHFTLSRSYQNALTLYGHQCDQIWRYFTTWTKLLHLRPNFTSIWEIFKDLRILNLD